MNTEAILGQILDKIGNLDNRFDVLDGKFDALEGRFDVLEKRTEAIFEQTAMLTEFKTETEYALAEINKTIESKYDLILRDIELIAGEQGKQRIEIARLKDATGLK